LRIDVLFSPWDQSELNHRWITYLGYRSIMKADTTVTTRLAACPVRFRPDDTSEMVTQFLFGEYAKVIEYRKDGWVHIELSHDGYQGWIDGKMLLRSETPTEGTAYCCLDIFGQVFSDKHSTWISLGANLPDYDGILAKVGGGTFRYSGQVTNMDELVPSTERIEKVSRRLLNVPYLWGGRTPLGLDCSGYTQLVYKCCGVLLKRDAKDQALEGDMVDFVSEARVGDLAFFSKKSDRITHVGIVLPENKIIHASGRVRIDTLDHYGIYNEEIQEYTHRLKIIRRYIP